MIFISFWGVMVSPDHSSGGQGCNCHNLQEKWGHEHYKKSHIGQRLGKDREDSHLQERGASQDTSWAWTWILYFQSPWLCNHRSLCLKDTTTHVGGICYSSLGTLTQGKDACLTKGVQLFPSIPLKTVQTNKAGPSCSLRFVYDSLRWFQGGKCSGGLEKNGYCTSVKRDGGYTRLGVSKTNVILAPITQSEIGVALIRPSQTCSLNFYPLRDSAGLWHSKGGRDGNAVSPFPREPGEAMVAFRGPSCKLSTGMIYMGIP